MEVEVPKLSLIHSTVPQGQQEDDFSDSDEDEQAVLEYPLSLPSPSVPHPLPLSLQILTLSCSTESCPELGIRKESGHALQWLLVHFHLTGLDK